MSVRKAKASPKASLIKRRKLKNGMDVLLIENHKAPVVSVQMWVKTGSADEQKGEEGISHFIEHLVFKGTERYGVGEIAAIVEASGGELNAYTSFDQTVFYVNISREFAEVGLDVIAQMMGFPKFDSGEIDNEREVVIEEIKRGNDSPGRQASRLLFSTVFKKHPYGIPVIGYDRVIKKVKRKTLADYYQSRYIPKNMHLVVAGDFETSEMAKRIDELFGRFAPNRLRKVTRHKEPKQSSCRIKVEKAAFEEAQFHFAWRVPGAAHKDVAALDVLAMILGQGESSRLAQKLRMESPITNSIGASTFTPRENGLFTISATLNVDQAEAAFNGLKNELLRMASEPPTPAELQRAIVNFESEEFYSMETIEGVARKAGSFENLMGDYNYFQKFMKQIYALKPEDILKAARKYLGTAELTIVSMVPRHEKQVAAHLKSWVKTYQKEYDQAKKAKIARQKISKAKKVKWSLDNKRAGTSGLEVEKHILKSGATVFFRPTHDTPVFSAKAGFLGGLRLEDSSQAGVTELLSRVWTSGTKDWSEAEIANRIENMAGGLSAFGGRNSVGLSLQSIAPFENEALDLFDEILVAPVINAGAVDREKTVMQEAIRSRDDNPGQIVSQMFAEMMFKGHPYARDLYGSRESVETLKLPIVNSHLAKMASAKNLTVAITGSVHPKLWLDRLEAATERLGGGAAVKNNFPHSGPKTQVEDYRHLTREQSHIIVGYKGLTLSDPRRYTLQVMQSILAGQGGRLFLELRDKASLAYTVSPLRMEGLETGYFGAYIGCSPEKGAKAIEMMNIEFRKLVDSKVGDAELERAKRYLIGRHDIDLQRSSAICSSILFNEIYGISSDEVFKYSEYLHEISAADVQKLASEIFSQPKVLAAVGPTKPW